MLNKELILSTRRNHVFHQWFWPLISTKEDFFKRGKGYRQIFFLLGAWFYVGGL